MARANNSPTNWKENVEIVENSNILSIFDKFRRLPPVSKHDVQGISERLDLYFNTCAQSKFIPTVESMTLALGVSRQAVWKWQQEECEAGRLISRAKEYINSLLTTATLQGEVAFPYAIWLQKNHFQYSDTQKIEIKPFDDKRALTASELPKLGNM